MTEKLLPGALLESFPLFKVRNAYYVDKTLFVEQVLNNPNQVQLYTRPRRFGKTLALSMLKTFLEKKIDRNGNPVDPLPYFEGKKIMACGDRILSQMGQYPVISLTLKDCGQPSFEKTLLCFQEIFSDAFMAFSEVMKSEQLTSSEKQIFQRYQDRNVQENDLQWALKRLTQWITKATGVKPFILIDEYDVPLQAAYLNGFYEEMVSFIRSLFSSGMKTNDEYFEKAVLTGCLRVSKESIFTGFNNLAVYSITDKLDDEYFGFTDDEVKQMLKYYELSDRWNEIHDWYDSYIFGTEHVFNPFSLVQCVKNLTINDDDAVRCYWVNTSGNDLVRNLVLKHPECYDDLEKLLHGEPIHKPIYETITYRDLDSFSQNVWTFLYFTGYIKSLSRKQIDDDWIHELVLVNKEIKAIFPYYIKMLFNQTVNSMDLSVFYQAVWDKNANIIKDYIDNILFNMVSYYDTQENFYHGMMLGILSNLYMYEVKSNRENGLGRTDIVLYDMRADRAIVFEFKWAQSKSELKGLSRIALEQVREKRYAEGIHGEGYATVYAVGIGFFGKVCEVSIEEL